MDPLSRPIILSRNLFAFLCTYSVSTSLSFSPINRRARKKFYFRHSRPQVGQTPAPRDPGALSRAVLPLISRDGLFIGKLSRVTGDAKIDNVYPGTEAHVR